MIDPVPLAEKLEKMADKCRSGQDGIALREAAVVLREAAQPQSTALAEWKRTPTDKDLAALLPTLPLAQRIEAVIRKYVGGAVSKEYDGDTSANVADARIAAYLLRKMRPWLPKESASGPLPAPAASPSMTDLRAKAEQWLASNPDAPYGSAEDETRLDVQHHNEAYDIIEGLLSALSAGDPAPADLHELRTERLALLRRVQEIERAISRGAGVIDGRNI